MARIRHIALFSKDQETLVSFYKDTFGMKEVHRHGAEGEPDGAVAIYLSDGHINLAILPAGDRYPEGIDHFGFQVEDIDETARKAGVKGALPPKTVPTDGRFAEAYIRDPVGTRVDLSEQGWKT